jgi:hypothetical protein
MLGEVVMQRGCARLAGTTMNVLYILTRTIRNSLKFWKSPGGTATIDAT